jgi:hypothetical protein
MASCFFDSLCQAKLQHTSRLEFDTACEIRIFNLEV